MILSFFLISKYADDSTLILEDDTQSLNHANFSAIWLQEQVNFQWIAMKSALY